jgi:hypothetical protein
MKTYVYLCYLSEFLQWEMFQTEILEKTKTQHSVFNTFFHKIVPSMRPA